MANSAFAQRNLSEGIERAPAQRASFTARSPTEPGLGILMQGPTVDVSQGS